MSYSELDDITFEQIKDFIENGNIKSVPPKIAQRLSLMELIRSLMVDQHKDYAYIIRYLQLPPYDLSRYLADKIYTDTINFHYAQKDISEPAICNMYAEKLDNLAKICIAADKFEEALRCFERAANYRLKAAEKKEIPDEIYDKRPVLYSVDPALSGGKKVNRNLLAKYIDELPDIADDEKQRLHRDAMTGKKNGFFFDVTDAELDFLNNEDED